MTAPGESNVSIYLDEQCTKLIAKLPVYPKETSYDLEVSTTPQVKKKHDYQSYPTLTII